MIKAIIIDDSQFIGERLSNMLNDIDGVMVAGRASCAKDGLALACTTEPDFIILDIRLPDVSGIEIIADIKKIDPEISIAMITNYPYPSYRKFCMELGADYFFDKSNEFSKLIGLLTDLAREKNGRLPFVSKSIC